MLRSVLAVFVLAVLATVGGAAQTGEQTGAQVTVSGERVTRGDAVDCPTIRAADGTLHPVSYLSPTIPIGGRVTVRGFYAVTVGCLGTVLVVEEEHFHPTD